MITNKSELIPDINNDIVKKMPWVHMANQELDLPWEILKWVPGLKTGNPGLKSVCTIFPWTTQYFKTDWS